MGIKIREVRRMALLNVNDLVNFHYYNNPEPNSFK